MRDFKDLKIAVAGTGPASFIMPLQIGKTPIVVPRQHQFNEHVNDHQVEFARNVAKRMGTIIEVEDIETLGDVKVSRICINQKEVMQPLHPELRSGSISFLRDTSRYSHPESGTCGC